MLKIYNTPTRKIEEFIPINKGHVRMYTCGPTVYGLQHIGNYRAYINADILRRVLILDGYEVLQIMNVTDVGHIVSNEDWEDWGEDKLEKKARLEGKTAWEIADYYTKAFEEDIPKLNIERPTKLIRATQEVDEQIKIIKGLIDKGMAYVTESAVYFDITKFPKYADFARLNMDDQQVAVREEVVVDKNKRNPFDFRLWQLDQPNHVMSWDSPWGRGFPGWHIECSAISMKYLGPHFDIHTGGVDHINVHHTNEIAQSESYTGEKFVNYWVHVTHLIVDGQKMSKSLGNDYKLKDIEEKGFDALALRYLYLTAHYRSQLNFTWQSLEAAQITLNKLKQLLQSEEYNQTKPTSVNPSDKYTKAFTDAVNDDLNTPQAIAILWDMIKDNDYPIGKKIGNIELFDKVLGLNLEPELIVIPAEIEELVNKRQQARDSREWEKSDVYRGEIEDKGYYIEDTENGPKIIKKNS